MLVEFGGSSPFAVLVFRGTEQNTSDYLTDLETGELSLVKDKQESLPNHFFDPPKPLADHAPINYVDRI